MNMIAIDPGASGGIAWMHDEPASVEAVAMPVGMTAQADLLRSLSSIGFRKAIIERVGGYMPGNSGPAACKFARHCGHIEAACYAYGIAVEYVAPQTWMKAIGTWPRDKSERKRAIKEAMARRYPYLDVTLKTADALGIMTWAEKKANNNMRGGE